MEEVRGESEPLNYQDLSFARRVGDTVLAPFRTVSSFFSEISAGMGIDFDSPRPVERDDQDRQQEQ